MSDEKIKNILNDWQAKGNDSNPENPAIPLHPEFHYRLTGEWKGWNDFLGVPQCSSIYKENHTLDLMENKAWELYKRCIN